jgi:solute carrier family 35 protein F1/2
MPPLPDAAAAVHIAQYEDYQDTSAERPRRRSTLGALYHRACAHLRSQYKILIAGQVLSLSLSVTGAAQSSLYFDCDLSAPTFTVGFFYFALIFCLVPVYRTGKQQLQGVYMGTRHQVISTLDDDDDENNEESDFVGTASARSPNQMTASRATGPAPSASSDSTAPAPQHTFLGFIPLHNPAWRYFPMALLDVYANYFTVLAFSYTTMTSVTLFDALAIPTAMVVSAVFLSRRYTRLHLLGVGACSVGILVNVLQDYEHDIGGGSDVDRSDGVEHDDVSNGVSGPYYPNKLRGDLMAMLGGILFGINNTVGEVAVRSTGGPNEYLGMLGVYATCICLVQSLLFERDEIAEFFNKSGNKSSTCSASTAWFLLFAYFVSAVLCYLGASRFLQVSEACFFNLSLLTGDLWSVLFSVVAQRIVPQPLFFVALTFILSGVVAYEMAPSPVEDDSHPGVAAELDHDDFDHGEEPRKSWRRPSNPQCYDHEHFELELPAVTQ